MSDLLERLEKATGPDRALDEAILLALDDKYHVITKYYDEVIGWDTINGLSWRTYAHPAPVTDHVDAALALLKKVLDDETTDPVELTLSSVGLDPAGPWKCALWAGDENHWGEKHLGKTPALAVLTALFKSLPGTTQP